jgi:hypothetical protein
MRRIVRRHRPRLKVEAEVVGTSARGGHIWVGDEGRAFRLADQAADDLGAPGPAPVLRPRPLRPHTGLTTRWRFISSLLSDHFPFQKTSRRKRFDSPSTPFACNVKTNLNGLTNISGTWPLMIGLSRTASGTSRMWQKSHSASR